MSISSFYRVVIALKLSCLSEWLKLYELGGSLNFAGTVPVLKLHKSELHKSELHKFEGRPGESLLFSK